MPLCQARGVPPPCRAQPCEPHSRIGVGIGDIGDEIARDGERPEDERGAEQDRVILDERGVVGRETDAGIVEDDLLEDCSA